MTLHRFFLPPQSLTSTEISFPPEISHQIHRVLRLQSGDRVITLDGTGNEYIVCLTSVDRVVSGNVEETRPGRGEPSIFLTLYQGLVKGAKFETILQHCTEVGVSRFVPIVTERSVAGPPTDSRRQRFESIVREAAEQSRRGRLPIVEEPLPFAQAAEQATRSGPAVMLWEDEDNRALPDVRWSESTGSISLIVGPEGGFSTREVDLARDAGVNIVTLGPRILRAETAAIVGSALVLYELARKPSTISSLSRTLTLCPDIDTLPN